MQTAAVITMWVMIAQPTSAPPTRSTPPATAADNPLVEEWTTPFGVPPFEKIKPEHFLPAFERAIDARRREVQTISASSEAPSFANTIEALEDGGQLLDKVRGVFFNLTSAETNDALQAVAKEVAPRLSALRDDMYLDERLFGRVEAVWQQRDQLDLTPEQQKLLEETRKSFVRGGAKLGVEPKKRLREINQEQSLLGLKFGDNLLAETNAYRLVIEKQADLVGLPESVVAAAADAAKAAGLEGKWVFTLQAPSIWPFLTYAQNRELRRQILQAYAQRGDRGDERDNKKILARIANLRVERAKLLGYKTHADFVLEENMAKAPDKVYDLLARLWKPALAMAKREAAALQKELRKDDKRAKLEPWDWRFYAEKVRSARYGVDEEALRPYFALDNVREGAFWLAGKLYGLRFKGRADLPKYHPEVRTFEVQEADGKHVGIFLVDYHPRPGKRGGAWSNEYRSQWATPEGQNVRPVVVNVCNFSRATGGKPALLSLEEVETLFHEFGHGLHALLSNIRYRSLGNVPRDFVELPSQIMENWVLEPEVLAVYAKHWQTEEPIPDALVAKVRAAEQFNQGFATVEYLAASFLDMDWHTRTRADDIDPVAFEKASLAKIRLMPEILSRYRSPYFSHIFGSGLGYSAGYYSYIWSEVLDADAFEAFKEKGILDPGTAASFRKNVLEPGGTAEAMELYKRFRGREPSVEPLLVRRGLKASSGSSGKPASAKR